VDREIFTFNGRVCQDCWFLTTVTPFCPVYKPKNQQFSPKRLIVAMLQNAATLAAMSRRVLPSLISAVRHVSLCIHLIYKKR